MGEINELPPSDFANRVEQEKFAAVPYRSGRCLNIHGRPGDPKRLLIVFVHGLLGRGYRTWGNFPALIFDDFASDADIGIFDHRSGAGRHRLTRAAVSPGHASKLLVTELTLSGYTEIIMIGHSLGGAISLLATWHMDDQARDPEILFPVRGIFLLATPRIALHNKLGSNWHVRRDSGDRQSGSENLKLYIDNRLILDHNAPAENDRHHVPIFSASASGDFWIDQLSASLPLPPSQTHRFSASHTSIVKPASRSDPIVAWIHDRLRKLIDRV